MKKAKKKRKVKKLGPLSFDLDDGSDGASDNDDSEAAQVSKKKKLTKKITKNPNVETDFLPDKDRELEEARERGRLRAEWETEQERIKSEIAWWFVCRAHCCLWHRRLVITADTPHFCCLSRRECQRHV